MVQRLAEDHARARRLAEGLAELPGDYAGSDCGHGEGAAADKGDVTWTKAGGTLTITGVTLNGLGGLPVTITVHSAYGHYSTDVVSVFPTFGGAPLSLPPGVGFSQVQVAP